ncbi:hypothetical protein ACMGT0_14860 [Pseudomonas sp. RHF3.3-3]|uniref:hypothetical protein n=1 Tax=Pseudomonas sp. RHF3.3-3 TaxID=3396624 RepID=UPI003A8A89A5
MKAIDFQIIYRVISPFLLQVRGVFSGVAKSPALQATGTATPFCGYDRTGNPSSEVTVPAKVQEI